MDTIIIGGGIAGLLYAFYNTDCTVLTDKVGGGFSAPFQLGPKYLHKTEKTERLLNDLNLAAPVKTIKVGFYYDGKINSVNTEENRKKYFEKTRGITAEPYKSSMSEGSSEFEAYDLDLTELVGSLEKKIAGKGALVLRKVTQVDLIDKHVVVEKENKIYFNKLVVTCPKPVFCNLIGQFDEAKQFLSYPTTFVKYPELGIAGESLNISKDFENYDYVYFSQPNFLWHRATRIPGGFCFEYKGDESETAKKEGYEYVVLKIGQLVQRDDTIMYPDFVKFFGRYAQWKHSIKTKELVDELIR